MYILGVSVVQVHRGCWVGTSFLFIGGRKPTYPGFLLESTRKGRLISDAVVFSIRRGRILRSKFFSLEKPCPSGNRRGGRTYRLKWKKLRQSMSRPKYTMFVGL